MSIAYYVLDTTKPKYAGLIISAEAIHKADSNQAELSITPLINNRALVKIKGDQSALERPDPQDVILVEYTESDHDQILEWYYDEVIEVVE